MNKKNFDPNNFPSPFKKAVPIMNKLQSSGFEVYFVGGSLRDLFLNVAIHDIDLATNALPLEVKKIFPHSFDTGIQHGTITVVYHHENYEVTTFRNDGDYLDHRHPENVQFVRNLQEDLKRRDFTINALAMSPTGQIIDYYGGIDDLDAKIIRCVLNPYKRFEEDALRIFRAVRFTSQLDFKLETDTYLALKEKVHLLANISIERIHSEFIKMMLGNAWQKGIQIIEETNIAEFMPSIDPLKLVRLLKSTYKNVHFPNEELIWATLFYFEILPQNQISKVLAKWKTSNSVIKNVQEILLFCKNYEKGQRDYHLFYGLLRENIINGIFILRKFAELQLPDLITNYDSLPIHQLKDLAVSGSDLIQEANFTPGVDLGKMIKLIESKVLKGELINDHQQIIDFVKENHV
ncbi:CCA tRNA nucleotidyltransferase [Xylocopilactobacillus apicola]|uniref:CCA-adding enzyme n=1 Tax=Xylocopilactobacillus apicola TaxID=2932184 RepID=A0AAU9D1Q9_9LACO|nr:CCA tRNA nucleotidyltransferase [Xylocopilactobacillus apicola]BDR58656.1 CCA-adding enzyme [Xylocopilactobacillus apicola]